MTALAALWDFVGEKPSAVLDRMLAAQAIYGRHDAARSLGPVALGRRLWALTPEDAFDRGPIASADGALTLIADARIDNREELAAALGISGDTLATMSDADVILAVVAHWGTAGIERLVGAFAVILWDAPRQQMVLARDAFGERPLHYHRGQGFVAVASMPAGLHAHPAIDYAANVTMAVDFLALLPETSGASFFDGIERVLPGHVVTIEAGTTDIRRYWQPDTSPLQLDSDAAYADEMRRQIDRAVACRLRRVSGPVGAHLSAGLDSGIVAATAARQLAPERLAAFTAVPSVPVTVPAACIGDEGPLAAATAALHNNIDHVRISAPDASPVALMDRQFRLFQRPVLNPSNAGWNDAINDAAQARGIAVMLTGQLGNMTISHDGYQYLPELLRTLKWGKLLALLRRLSKRGMSNRHLAALTIGPFLPPWAWQRLSRLAGRELAIGQYSALRRDAYERQQVGRRAAARGLDLSYRPWRDSAAMRLWGMQRIDLGVYNKGTLAGWSIDLRDPTADRRLVEFALRVPDAQYLLDGVPRSLARRAFSDRLPASVTNEFRRGLQGADWPVHLTAARADIAAELDAFGRCAEADEVIDIAALRRALDDWPDGGWNEEAITLRYRHALLRGIAAGHFLRKVARTN